MMILQIPDEDFTHCGEPGEAMQLHTDGESVVADLEARNFIGEGLDDLAASRSARFASPKAAFSRRSTSACTSTVPRQDSHRVPERQIGFCNTLREHGLELRHRGIQITNNLLTCSL